MAHVIIAKRIFTGETFLEEHAIVIEDGRISSVVPSASLSDRADATLLTRGVLAPGFIDVQVNGGGGVNLNEMPTVEGVLQMSNAHRRFGTTGILPTVITDTSEIQKRAVAAVQQARNTHSNILGIHIEGPFLDPARKGAHDPALIRPLTSEDMSWLKSIDCGSVLLTLAPNRVVPPDIETLAKAGIHVCLGHAEAKTSEALVGLQAGAKGFTHLFNAMSQLTGREAGMVGAALSNADAYAGLIADGFHVQDHVLKLAISVKGPRHIMLVTDAMCTAAGGPDRFSLQGREVRLNAGRLELADGTLAGSNLTMEDAVRYCANQLEQPLSDVLVMASATPADFLGLGHELGRIAPGYRASFVHLNDDLKVMQTWVDGT